MFKSAIQININYTAIGENKTEINKLAHVDVPINASAFGTCEKYTQTLTLSWNKTDSNKTNEVVFTFILIEDKNQTSPNGNFSVNSVSVTIYKDNATFPNATTLEEPVKQTLQEIFFETPLNNSYRCSSNYKLRPVNYTSTVTLEFEHSQVEAFRKAPSNNTEFSKEYVCSGDALSPSDWVVGVILAVVIVLIVLAGVAGLVVFIIRKRRARGGSGYENM
jgi:hypothetical protein